LAAETLALTLGREEAQYLQTWLSEMRDPTQSARQLLALLGNDHMPIDCAVDCNDLYEVLIKPAAPNLTNRALILYIAALRHMKDNNLIRNWHWIDTRDMLANCLTKMERDGTLPLDEPDVLTALTSCYWEPLLVFKRNGIKTTWSFDELD
jgi:hypothetical protein